MGRNWRRDRIVDRPRSRRELARREELRKVREAKQRAAQQTAAFFRREYRKALKAAGWGHCNGSCKEWMPPERMIWTRCCFCAGEYQRRLRAGKYGLEHIPRDPILWWHYWELGKQLPRLIRRPRQRAPLPRRIAGLTSAQKRVFELAVPGFTNRQIAEKLGLKQGTVNCCISVMRRMARRGKGNSANRPEAEPRKENVSMSEAVTTKKALELLDSLTKLESNATPAPWEVCGHVKDGLTFDHERNIVPPETTKTHGFQFGGPVCVVQDNGEVQDAEFIGALRNEWGNIRSLIEEALAGRQWKAEQLSVEAQWNPQEVAGMLNVSLGQSIRASLGPRIAELIASLASERKEVEELQKQAFDCRLAIRHAVQFLTDPNHKGDGHIERCLAACRLALSYEPKTTEAAGRPHNLTGEKT